MNKNILISLNLNNYLSVCHLQTDEANIYTVLIVIQEKFSNPQRFEWLNTAIPFITELHLHTDNQLEMVRDNSQAYRFRIEITETSIHSDLSGISITEYTDRRTVHLQGNLTEIATFDIESIKL